MYVVVSTEPGERDGTTTVRVTVDGAEVACCRVADTLDPEAFAAMMRRYAEYRADPCPDFTGRPIPAAGAA